MIAETKIRQEDNFHELDIEGYDYFQIQRSDEEEDKQGGGLICYMRNDISTKYEIPINEIQDQNLKYVQKERGWIISKTYNVTTATCIVYAGCQFSDNRNEEWNQGIYQVISNEQQKYRDQGFRVLIIGDLNGHIGNKENGIKNNKPEINVNGQMILDFEIANNFKLLNNDKKN